MSVIQDYLQIRSALDAAVGTALQGPVADGLKKAIQEEALENVYSYEASPSAISKRREKNGGLIDESTMLTSVDGMTLTLENASQPQHAEGIALTPIVEEGWSSWHQPYARPFMEEARDDYVDNGDADRDIADALKAAGFTVF